MARLPTPEVAGNGRCLDSRCGNREEADPTQEGDGADRIRTGVLPHAVKARQPLRYEPHPSRDHTNHVPSDASELSERDGGSLTPSSLRLT